MLNVLPRTTLFTSFVAVTLYIHINFQITDNWHCSNSSAVYICNIFTCDMNHKHVMCAFYSLFYLDVILRIPSHPSFTVVLFRTYFLLAL